MAKLIVIDGPEKAGKTTFIDALMMALRKEGLSSYRRHWQTPDPKTFHSFVYTDPLIGDFKSDEYDVIIWDRSWVSEYVYPLVMPEFRGEKRVLWQDPWLAEWCYGRALVSGGMGIVLLGPDVETLIELRDDTDHACDPEMERNSYEYYGERFNWNTTSNQHSDREAASNARVVARSMLDLRLQQAFLSPPSYCGPVDAKVVFIAEARNHNSRERYSWLPFSTKYTTLLGREFGDQAFQYGWTNTEDLQAANQTDVFDFLCNKVVVACGKVAESYCDQINIEHFSIGHPSSGFRWGQGLKDYRASLERLKYDLQRRRVYEIEVETKAPAI